MKKLLIYLILLCLAFVPVASAKFIMPVQGGGGGGPVANPSYFGVASAPADQGAQQCSASPVTITPPASMSAGDLVVVVSYVNYDDAGSALTVSNNGGQSWSTLATLDSLANQTAKVFWCEFDGTWDTNPAFATSVGTVNAFTVLMIVFRPNSAAFTWGVDVAATDATASWSAFPYTTTVTGITTQTNYAVALCMLFQRDDNSVSSFEAGWSYQRVRNNTSNDNIIVVGYKFMETAGATGDIDITMSGNDAAYTLTTAFKES